MAIGVGRSVELRSVGILSSSSDTVVAGGGIEDSSFDCRLRSSYSL